MAAVRTCYEHLEKDLETEDISIEIVGGLVNRLKGVLLGWPGDEEMEDIL